MKRALLFSHAAIAIPAIWFALLPNIARSAPPKDQMVTIWMVQAVERPPGLVTAKRNEAILEQPLLPAGLAVLKAPFDGGEFKRLMPEGTQLFEVMLKSAKVYCAFEYKPPHALVSLLSRTATGTQICFVDRDRDGAFEGYFAASNSTPELPGIYGPLPKKIRPVEPLAYRVAEPSEFQGDLSVSIVYTGKGLVNNVRRYAVSYGSRTKRGRLTSDAVTHGKAFPLKVELLGSLISITSGEGQTITAEVLRPIPAQPFGVVVTVTTVYY